MRDNKIVILLVEDNKDFARLVEVYLQKYEKDKFLIIKCENGTTALKEAENQQDIDLILMDYFLPGMNGLEITKALMEKKINIPIVFLTVNKDFDLALEVLRHNVEDYLVKEEIISPVLPKTIIEILQKREMKKQLLDLEVRQKRIETLQKIVSQVVKNISEPLNVLGENIQKLNSSVKEESLSNYIRIINDNYQRILTKFEKIKELNQDETVTYIKGIKMIKLT
ncbi:MAG: two-component hybrid sensor and regulator [Ignavibacteriae bacterium]|nr:MAG: two-component hybrid sensor and regulator [Ignavibacteriota bacterium]